MTTEGAVGDLVPWEEVAVQLEPQERLMFESAFAGAFTTTCAGAGGTRFSPRLVELAEAAQVHPAVVYENAMEILEMLRAEKEAHR